MKEIYVFCVNCPEEDDVLTMGETQEIDFEKRKIVKGRESFKAGVPLSTTLTFETSNLKDTESFVKSYLKNQYKKQPSAHPEIFTDAAISSLLFATKK